MNHNFWEMVFLVFVTFSCKDWDNVLNYLHGWFVIISDQVDLCHCIYFKLSKNACHLKNSLIWYWSSVRILILQDLALSRLITDMNVIHGEGQTPWDLAILLAPNWTEARKKEECLLVAAGEDDLETLKMLASGCCQHEENRKVTGF
jgi:hypothetical protein